MKGDICIKMAQMKSVNASLLVLLDAQVSTGSTLQLHIYTPMLSTRANVEKKKKGKKK